MQKLRVFHLTCLVFGISAALPLLAQGETQVEAMLEAERLNRAASDASMQNSTTSAMKALMELGNHNRSGAISNGYQAFGQYRNSEDLDTLRLKNGISTLKMQAAASSLLGASKPIEAPPLSSFITSFKRLDPKFLREGEAAKVAAEFEQKTGMKREAFLQRMTWASENKIYPDDPQMIDKVLTRLEGFVKEIPNSEFRDNVQKEIDHVPQVARTGLVAQAVSKFAGMFAGGGASKSDIAVAAKPKETSIAAQDAPKAPAPKSAPAPSTIAAASSSRTPASIPAPAIANRDSGFRGVEKENWSNDAVGSVFQTALEEQKEDTIFKQISKKYRSLSPMLGMMGVKELVP